MLNLELAHQFEFEEVNFNNSGLKAEYAHFIFSFMINEFQCTLVAVIFTFSWSGLDKIRYIQTRYMWSKFFTI